MNLTGIPNPPSAPANVTLPTLGNQPDLTLPTLELPSLTMSDGASVTNQLAKLQSKDSLLQQQARVDAQEKGVASGAIHSSQQAGAAQRAVTDKLMPLAQSEAELVKSQDVANWTNDVNEKTTNWGAQVEAIKANWSTDTATNISNWTTSVTAEMDRYSKEYAGYLQKLGYSADQQTAMTAANTSMSNTMIGAITSLMNNPDVELGPEVMAKLTTVFNTALQNNNTILGMGFTY